MKLPDYSEHSGPELTLTPPFPFTNVNVAVFPLRAEPDTVQRFVDSYINIVPPAVGHFRVWTPYVYLMLLDYGKLANLSNNFGCFSQREMCFFVPLAWYKWIDERWLFHDWASVAPFIYVDGQLSLSLGRTAIGWPKSIVQMTPVLSGWLRDPDGFTTDICVTADVLPHTYTGARMERQPVVSVRSLMSSSLRVPFDPESPRAPWNVWQKFGASVAGLWQDQLNFLGGAGVFPPNRMTSPENFARMFQRGMDQAANVLPWAPNLTLNAINLKQFRCADDPKVPCYQALTCGPMRYTSFMRGGLLGSQVGDVSGGYEVDLARWPTFPVVDALGIEARTYSFADGPKVSRVKPVMPFWYEVNMEYDRTQTLALRGRDGQWLDDEGEPIRSRGHSKSRYFNTAIGAASPVVTGPFRFQAAAMRLLELSARVGPLQKFLDDFLNLPLQEVHERFQVWHDQHIGDRHARVYMVLGDWGDVTSETNSIGDWADMTLTLYIPVKRYHKDRFVGFGLVPAYSFARGTIHACTLTELYGIRTTEATFVEGTSKSSDLERIGPFNVLDLSVESVPALNEGQMVRSMRLLELVDTGIPKDHVKLSPKPGKPGWLGGGVPVYTLKQFRDVDQSSRACYQALVRVPYHVRVNEVLEVPRKAELHLHPIPMFPIYDKLGLVDHSDHGAPYGLPRVVNVDRWLLLDTEIILDNGVELYSRTGIHWQEGPDTHCFQEPAPFEPDVGPDAVISEWINGFPSDPPPSWGMGGAKER